jgi:hypothetical protein
MGMKETEVAQYPARIARRDNTLYVLTATVLVTLVATVGFLLVRSTAPVGAEAYDVPFITVTASFAFYALYKLISRNAARNERNRLHFSQLLRNTARHELTAQLSLEDAERVATGGVVRLHGYNIWLKRNGSKVSLMTDKVIGIRQLQNS